MLAFGIVFGAKRVAWEKGRELRGRRRYGKSLFSNQCVRQCRWAREGDCAEANMPLIRQCIPTSSTVAGTKKILNKFSLN